MKLKNLFLSLFILALVLIFAAIVLVDPGWGRSSLFFAGVLSAITGMAFLLVYVLKSER